MDTRYFGSNLLALDRNAAAHRRIWTEAGEDTYYRQHTPGEQRRIPRFGFVIVGLAVGFLTLGLWPS